MNTHTKFRSRFMAAALLPGLFLSVAAMAAPPEWYSTRITDPGQVKRTGDERYPFRDHADFILKELDLQPGDAIIDIGAGDGWWSDQFAGPVGPTGKVYAAEVEDKLVDELKKRFADTPRVEPIKCPFDSTGLPENSVDVAFFSQVYHHIDADGQVAYLEGLRKTVKPLGRLVIIERYIETVTQGPGHGSILSELITEAESAGWACLRYELIPGTYHYLAIFAQSELFPPEKQPQRNQRRGGGEERNDAAADVETPVATVETANEVLPRFASNSPFAAKDQSPKAGKEKQIWARSMLWEKAPEFVAESWIGPEPDMKGKYVLLEFWATSSPPSRKSIAVLNDLHEKFGDELVVVGISDEPAETVRKLEEPKIEYYSAIDTQARIKDAYGVFGIPHAVIIEPEGYVVWEGFPLLKDHELTVEEVDRILQVGRDAKAST